MFKKNFARFVTHWFAETWAAILANASALQTALLAFIGALVFFAAVGVAAPWVMPLALLTLGIVYLVEIAILTKMTKQGLAKFNGYFYKQADLGEHVIKVEDGDQLVALDEVQIEFYRSRADAYFSNSPQLADVNIDINAQPPELKPTLDLLYTNQQKLDLLLNHHVHHQLNTDVKELSAGRSTTYEAINDLKKSILQAIKGKCQTSVDTSQWDTYLNLRIAEKLQHELHEKSHHECPRSYQSLYQSARVVVMDCLESVVKTVHDGSYEPEPPSIGKNDNANDKKDCVKNAYRRRIWLLRALSVPLAIAAFFFGKLAYSELMGSFFPKVLVGLMHVSQSSLFYIVASHMVYPFAVLCALAYFYQLYQTLSTVINSNLITEWWRVFVGALRHARDDRPLRMIPKILTILILNIGVMVLSIIATICCVDTFLRIMGNSAGWVRWLGTITLSINEVTYGLAYSSRTSQLLTQMFVKIGLLKDYLKNWFKSVKESKQGYLNWQSQHPTRSLLRATYCFLVLFPLQAVVDGFMMSFEMTIFIGHAVLLGFQGDNNRFLNANQSVAVTTLNEVVQDAALYFEPHDHGLFDTLCRFIKALLTYIPGMLIGVLTVMGRPHTNNAGDAPKYTHAMVFFGKVYCFHEHKSALYHWLKYFNEFVAYDQPVHDAALSAQKDDQGAAKNSVNWPQFLNKCFKALWWLAIVYLVVSIFFPPLLGLNVAAGTAATFGGWLLAHIGISAAAHTGVYVSLGICAVFNPSSFGYMGALLNPAYRNDLASQKNTVLNLVSKKLSNNTKLYSECQSLCQELSPAVQQPSDPCQPMNYQDACDVLSTHRYKWGHSSSNTRTYRFFKKVESVFGQQTVKDWFTPKSSTSV